MKIVAYATRPDEMEAFDFFSKELNMDIKYVQKNLSKETIDEARGVEYVTILGNCDASADVLEGLKGIGVKYVASRSVGYNNIDLEKAKELGIRVSNSNYSPYCVSDFTLMTILMIIRKVNLAIKRNKQKDFSLNGIQGREMHNLTVGVIGTGRIGQNVIKGLYGFGTNILAYDLYENEDMKKYAKYVDIDTIYEKCDIITLHTPLFASNHHLISKKTIDKMKDGVIIINTARGELINTKDILEGLKNGKIGGAGLDVLEGEEGIFHTDCTDTKIKNDDLLELQNMPNVVLTQHFAFYTDQAVYDMVKCGLESLRAFKDNKENRYEILK